MHSFLIREPSFGTLGDVIVVSGILVATGLVAVPAGLGVFCGPFLLINYGIDCCKIRYFPFCKQYVRAGAKLFFYSHFKGLSIKC